MWPKGGLFLTGHRLSKGKKASHKAHQGPYNGLPNEPWPPQGSLSEDLPKDFWKPIDRLCDTILCQGLLQRSTRPWGEGGRRRPLERASRASQCLKVPGQYLSPSQQVPKAPQSRTSHQGTPKVPRAPQSGPPRPLQVTLVSHFPGGIKWTTDCLSHFEVAGPPRVTLQETQKSL